MLKYTILLLFIVIAITTNKFTYGDDVPCTKTSDCTKPNEAYDCVNDVCTCTGVMAFVEEENKTMCIAAVYLMNVCVYDEQCLLTDANSYCADSVGASMCDCLSGYEMNMDNMQDPTSWYCYVPCATTANCSKPNEVYECVDNECTCTRDMTYVEEESKDMCIAPVYLMNVCAYDEQCTLTDVNSYCADSAGASMCDCVSGYDMNMDNMQDPSSWYCYVPCTTAADCSKPNEVYECVKNECTCTRAMTYVKEESKDMCIAPVYLMYPCVYDEQCTLTDVNSFCDPSASYTCNCTSGYNMDMSNMNDPSSWYCYSISGNNGGWSTGAIAGVAVGSAAAVAVIGGIIVYFVKFVE